MSGCCKSLAVPGASAESQGYCLDMAQIVKKMNVTGFKRK